MYARAKNGAIYWGMGISQLSHGTASALGLIHLALLTGHIGREGTGLNPLRGQNNVQGASDAGAMPFHFPGYMEVDKPGNAEKWEQAWHVEPGGLSRRRGLTTTEILANAHPGGIRALYIMGENPMMTEPNLNATREHMQQLEFIVAAGFVYQRERGVCRCDSAGCRICRERGHVHQHRPAGATSAARAQTRVAQHAPTPRSSAIWQHVSRRVWAVRTARVGRFRTPKPSFARWPMSPQCSRA